MDISWKITGMIWVCRLFLSYSSNFRKFYYFGSEVHPFFRFIRRDGTFAMKHFANLTINIDCFHYRHHLIASEMSRQFASKTSFMVLLPWVANVNFQSSLKKQKNFFKNFNFRIKIVSIFYVAIQRNSRKNNISLHDPFNLFAPINFHTRKAN